MDINEARRLVAHGDYGFREQVRRHLAIEGTALQFIRAVEYAQACRYEAVKARLYDLTRRFRYRTAMRLALDDLNARRTDENRTIHRIREFEYWQKLGKQMPR